MRVASAAFLGRSDDSPAVSGFFQLSYGGETTGPLGADASPTVVRHALEALAGVGSVAVSRDFSAAAEPLTACAAETGHPTLVCAGLTAATAPQPADLISVGGSWYAVADAYDPAESPTEVHLALASSAAVDTSYGGETAAAVDVYAWAGGHEWAVEFLSNAAPAAIASPAHALVPTTASVGVRPLDCDECVYATGLAAFGLFYVRARAINDLGPGPWSDVGSSMPRRVPDAPASFSLEVLAGDSIQVFWYPPATVSGTILGYSLHWDDALSFADAESADASCDSAGFGNCLAEGAVIAGTPPYDFVAGGLSINTTYYFRIAARNELYDATADEDVAAWSEVLYATTAEQVPLAPTSSVLALAGADKLQLQFARPLSDGGTNLTAYLVEYDTSASFSSPRRVNFTSAFVEDAALYENGPSVVVLEDLVAGAMYYARVAAANDVGASAWATASNPTAPAAAPDACGALGVSTVDEQSGAPITTLDVSWLAPGNATDSNASTAENGSPITGYLVEWYTAEATCEEQIIRATWETGTTPSATAGFVLQYSNGRTASTYGVTTSKMTYDAAPSVVRSSLMNLGHTAEAPHDSEYVAGALEVDRVATNNFHGYAWRVRFQDCEAGGLNEGDVVPINVPESSVADSLEIDVGERTPGARSLGNAEVQVITLFGDLGDAALAANATDQPVRGFFRLGFDGSAYSGYVPATATAAQVEEALELLPTISQVSVTAEPYLPSPTEAGVRYRVTFATDVGDQPALFKDDSYLFSPGHGALAMSITGADNAVDDTTGLKEDDTVVGEAPARYGSALVDADDLAYTIEGLESGIEYYVRVAAVNAFGAGPPITSASNLVPQQIADPPTNVSLGVNYADADSLTVRFDGPESDGGSTISHYRVELDPTDTFDDPIREDFYCPTANKRTVWKIATAGTGASNPIVDGTFSLSLTVSGQSYATDPIPYDAVGAAVDETGVEETLASSGAVSARTFAIVNGSNRVTASGALTGILFDGDLVRVEGQKHAGEVYRAALPDPASDTFRLLDPSTGENRTFLGASAAAARLTRIHGGRGTSATSEVFCEAAPGFCAAGGRLDFSGSVESKLEALDELIDAGVNVSRYGPDDSNGFSWFVTFLDDSPSAASNDFALSLSDNSLVDANGTVGAGGAAVTLTQWQAGETYLDCTGAELVVPSDGSGLQNGLVYFARVTAVNSVGYSLPQSAAASMKPMTVPGAPTSVVLSTISATQLRVQFSSPAWDGGDEITSYLVQYATDASFASGVDSVVVTYLDGGSPFYKTISGLAKGSRYYVRVSAGNSQGYGSPQATAPSSAAPYEESSAPSDVELGITSDSMLTVGYSYPSDDGGDPVASYRVEWDTSSSFNSLSASPHKGTVDVDADTAMAYTIDELTVSTTYFVRVKAVNAAGYGTASATLGAAPALQVPGIPRSVDAGSGSSAGEIDVSWLYPRVPHHGVPCSAFAAAPAECPTALGGSVPESTGGSAIIEYEVEWNEREAFDGTDGGAITTTATSLTIAGLTEERGFYVRVLARNSVGSGRFCENAGSVCTGAALYAVATADA